ncbi:MAG: hypothetical protein ACFFDW_17265 [Candidatus Thorarchaeota archaeon]
MLYLPDHRVEKAAYLSKKANHKVYFAGNVKENFQSTNFDGIFNIPITPKNKLGYNLTPLLENLQKLIREYDFDVIHASNIYCAIIADKLNIPLIFDDREFYSYEMNFLPIFSGKLKDSVANLLMRIRYPQMEKKIIRKWPMITVSNEIIKMYKKINPKTNGYYFPNMPLLSEVKNFNPKNKGKNAELKTMYVGLNDFSKKISYRDTTGLLPLWINNKLGELVIIGDRFLKSNENIISTGFISQEEVYNQLLTGHLGLIGWHPHPYHKICSLNKIYNYIHSGLEIIYPHTLTVGDEIAEVYSKELERPFGFKFKEFNEIVDYISKNKTQILKNNSLEINRIARENFILNNYQNNLFDAYTHAIEIHNKK